MPVVPGNCVPAGLNILIKSEGVNLSDVFLSRGVPLINGIAHCILHLRWFDISCSHHMYDDIKYYGKRRSKSSGNTASDNIAKQGKPQHTT